MPSSGSQADSLEGDPRCRDFWALGHHEDRLDKRDLCGWYSNWCLGCCCCCCSVAHLCPTLQPHGHGFGWTPGVDDGQGGLACWGSWGRKESDMTEWLNWTELQPHGLQHTRLPCPSLCPGVCSNSSPFSRWCHPTISSSHICQVHYKKCQAGWSLGWKDAKREEREPKN